MNKIFLKGKLTEKEYIDATILTTENVNSWIFSPAWGFAMNFFIGISIFLVLSIFVDAPWNLIIVLLIFALLSGSGNWNIFSMRKRCISAAKKIYSQEEKIQAEQSIRITAETIEIKTTYNVTEVPIEDFHKIVIRDDFVILYQSKVVCHFLPIRWFEKQDFDAFIEYLENKNMNFENFSK